MINNDFSVAGYNVDAGSGGSGITIGADGSEGTQIQDQTPGYLRDVIYVDLDATGSNNGATWDDAFRDLQDAIDSATSGDQIWVAAGMYVPTANEEDRDASFELKSGVSLYGGFYGGTNSISESELEKSPWSINLAGETSIEEADPYRSARFTNLSGDIKYDDTRDNRGTTRLWQDQDNAGSNSRNVILADGVTDVELNGFFITAGRSDNGVAGAGLRSINSSLVLNRCLIRGNRSSTHAAGIYASSDSVAHTLEMNHCIFLTNYAEENGACVYVGDNMTLTAERLDMHGNLVGLSGAAFHFEGADASVLENVMIAGNKSNLDAGAISVDSTNLTLNHVTVTGNSATSSSGTKTGGVYLTNGAHVSGVNTVLWRNANNSFSMDSSTASWDHCIVASSGGSASWDTSFGTDVGGNFDEDPLFSVDLDPSKAPTLDGNLGGSVSFYPDASSPAVDGGTTGTFISATDAEGNGRVSNGVRDIGACEYQSATSQGFYVLVSQNAAAVADLDEMFQASGLTYSFSLHKSDVVDGYIIDGSFYTSAKENGGTPGRSTSIVLYGDDGTGVVETINISVQLIPEPSLEVDTTNSLDTFCFTRKISSGTFTPQVSTDLVNWTNVDELTGDEAILTTTITDNDDSNVLEDVELEFNTRGDRLFYRLSMDTEN